MNENAMQGVKRLSTCPQCGFENKPGSSFCVKCGASIGTAAQPVQPETPVPGAAAQPRQTPPTPPPQAAPPVAPPQTGVYAQQPVPGGGYAAAPAAYATGTSTRGALFWIGALMVLVTGAVVLISTWLSWGTGPTGILSLTGWDWFDIGNQGLAGSGEVANAFFVYSSGYPLFTGLCSLIVGGIIALVGALMLIFRSKGIGSMAILFSIFALGMSITNMTTIFRQEGISMGVGMWLFVVFSLIGLVGGSMAMAD
ncbi:MAG: zinc ribbon domain-containing protein [Actinomycetota bacterium]|nr:zinc ribbon domain-containing protein [Actinomycetota bacterium]